MPTPYALPADVYRKLDLNPDRLDGDTRERLRARLEAVAQEFDRATGAPRREIRVGTPDTPATWEYHDARTVGTPPVLVDLEHDPVAPIDAAAGDTVELRTGRDTWEDVTAEAGDSFVADYERGQLKLYRFLIHRGFWERPSERFLRITYRHGTLGGRREAGGRTTLTSDVGAGETTLSVADAGALPASPGVCLLGAPPGVEYIRVRSVATDTLTVSRGARGTSTLPHDADAPVTYVPPDIRDAVAARVAEQAALFDETQVSIPDDGQLTSRQAKADRFQTEWQQACERYSGVRTL